MIADNMERLFREKFATEIRIRTEGLDRFRILTPFTFDDGDTFSIFLRKGANGWFFSDEGHTFMHLSYDFDERELQKGTRQKIIANTLSVFSVEEKDGELFLPVCEDNYGDALFSFIQAINRITDVSFLSRETARSTFFEDFKSLIISTIPETRRAFNWYDKNHDPQGKYVVDCKINNLNVPIFIFALSSDDKTRDATITVLQYEKWGIKHRAVGVFEDQEIINRRVLSRFTDVCDKQFSSLSVRNRIEDYLKDSIATCN